jgi:hypothetical protein
MPVRELDGPPARAEPSLVRSAEQASTTSNHVGETTRLTDDDAPPDLPWRGTHVVEAGPLAGSASDSAHPVNLPGSPTQA